MKWQQVWNGTMWVAEQSVQPDGRIFERVLRAPGSRIMVIKDGKLLLNREKRGELGNRTDYRLPGGKVFDTNEEYQSFLASGQDIIEASRQSVTREALEEAGLIVDPLTLEYLGVDILGATVAWDLHFWVARDFKVHTNGAQFHESEADEIEGSVWLSLQDITKVVLDPAQFSESRSSRMILMKLQEEG